MCIDLLYLFKIKFYLIFSIQLYYRATSIIKTIFQSIKQLSVNKFLKYIYYFNYFTILFHSQRVLVWINFVWSLYSYVASIRNQDISASGNHVGSISVSEHFSPALMPPIPKPLYSLS